MNIDRLALIVSIVLNVLLFIGYFNQGMEKGHAIYNATRLMIAIQIIKKNLKTITLKEIDDLIPFEAKFMYYQDRDYKD